jgi:hypothetical protein
MATFSGSANLPSVKYQGTKISGGTTTAYFLMYLPLKTTAKFSIDRIAKKTLILDTK